MSKVKIRKIIFAAVLLTTKFRERIDPLGREMMQNECASPNIRLVGGNSMFEK